MKYTSAQANKLLRKLMEDRADLLSQERQSSRFVAATTENIEDARPAYQFAATQEKLDRLEEQIRTVKHAISLFNLTHTPPDMDMTADQLLTYIPQLTEQKARLSQLANALPKTRLPSNGRTNLIEYEHANYDVEEAQAAYQKVSTALSQAQLALDTLNNTETMEIPGF